MNNKLAYLFYLLVKTVPPAAELTNGTPRVCKTPLRNATLAVGASISSDCRDGTDPLPSYPQVVRRHLYLAPESFLLQHPPCFVYLLPFLALAI
jgi:hypothetical protein